jgi:hypothetical protein
VSTHLARVWIAVAAVAASVNLLLTITSDAQTGWDDLQAATQRIEARQIEACP